MSAFVVGEDTMLRVVRGICAQSKYGPIVRQFAGFDTQTADAPTKIGRKLFAMNIEAVKQRYPDCRAKPADMPGPIGDDDKSLAPKLARCFKASCVPNKPDRAEMVAVYKAMSCLEYQCSEGNIPETPLFAELTKATAAVAESIVRELPEYGAAPWG